MAFIPGSIANKVKPPRQTTGGFVPGSIAGKNRFTLQDTSGFIPGSVAGLSPRGASRNLKSSEGLYNLAVQSGLQGQADRILESQKGEETKRLFSGGFISDIFDVLNAVQYGITGLLKGTSFSVGVKTRQSFSDQDALGSKGLPGVIAGIGLDIAVDPFTYIAPWTIARKIRPLAKAGKAIKEAIFGKKVTKVIEGTGRTFQDIEGGTRLGRITAQKLVWMSGADPVFRRTWERGLKNTLISAENITQLARGISKLKPSVAAQILKRDKTGRFVRVGINKLQKLLSPDELEVVRRAYNKIDEVGKEATELGLLSKGKFEEGFGTYLKSAYEEFELAKKAGIFGAGRVGVKKMFSRNKNLTQKQMKELGQIDNPAYLIFKSAFDLSKNVENTKLFNAVAKKFASNVNQSGFTKLPEGIRLGALSGKYVPNHMADYITAIVAPIVHKTQKKIVANFKFFKVIMNPATHARNIMSNQLLNYWKLGMNPLDPRVIRANAKALREITKGSGKWSDEARPLGYNLNTFASAELKSILNSAEVSAWGKSVSNWSKTKKKLGDIYQAEENQAKLTAYIFQRTIQKIKPEEAWKAAESATFNYAQVTPFIRKLRESLFGFPFITFTVKSTPLVAETLVKAPQRISVLGKIKQGIENLSDIEETAAERASEPFWVKDGFYVKLPMKDSLGRSAYFDLTYILPFGDLLAGNFFERGQDLKTGLPKSFARAGLEKSPVIQVFMALGKNRDFFGNSIWKNSDDSYKQLQDLMTYLIKAYAPPLLGDQLPGGYNRKGERQYRGVKGALTATEENQRRNIMQELLRNVGAKIQPIDADIQETYTEWNKRTGLQNLLKENGILEQFEINYIPTKD